MKLLLDIGNTRIKWAWLRDGQLFPCPVVTHNRQISAVAEQHFSQLQVPSKVIIASGLEAHLEDELESWVAQHWSCPVEFLRTPQHALGVTNAYKEPKNLGIDRWVNLVACHHLLEGAACIVDCGTAVTVDAIDASGRHLGGCILPGLSMMRESLNQAGQIDLKDYDSSMLSSVNTSTKESVVCGTLYAVTKAVDAILDEMKRLLVDEVKCVVTGGDAELVQPFVLSELVYERDWSLQGMKIIVSSEQ